MKWNWYNDVPAIRPDDDQGICDEVLENEFRSMQMVIGNVS